MREILFGWITKGRYQVSFLDTLVASGEVVLTVVICFYAVLINDKLRRWRRGNK